ncbi:acetyltransferase [Paenibacillus sp. L3-i20]|uniref:acetyltransferase n=1 Tax=Paenibacillus sp. L3-i20 TaxID=2905833 RepID=UPI001EE0316B|nr:acetyltransferase [Paenibacillus sp. L3-i20]GKU75837.1 transferase [Paenibacillus sp. L3-i20]
MTKKIVVFGAGGHAKTVIDVIEKGKLYTIVGLLDNNKPVGQIVYGYNILGDDHWLAEHASSIDGAIVAIGDNWIRGSVVKLLRSIQPSLPFISAIHPSAQIARGANIGVGSVVMAGAVVGSDTEIGDHCILYPNVSVDHDSTIDNFVSFAPRSVTGGNVHIGSFSAIAISATVIHGITIGEHCVIGASATVLSNIAPYTVAYGTPARFIRTRKQGECYL